jgi:hypothetical protein
MDDTEAWTFSYKSQGSHSTTGKRWRGYVRFLKENVLATDNVEDLDCKLYCDCPDYVYRYAYNNNRTDAGDLGRNNGQPPRPRNAHPPGVGDFGNGMCKHLAAIGRFLESNINAPEPDDEKPSAAPAKEPSKIAKTRPSQGPRTVNAPAPDDSYSDSRSGDSSYSDGRELQEGRNGLYDKFNQFVKSNPEFEVPYD